MRILNFLGRIIGKLIIASSNFWQWLSNVGVTNDLSASDKRSVTLLNKTNFILILLAILALASTMYVYLFFDGGKPGTAALRLILMALFNLVSILFVFFKRRLTAKIITSVIPLFFLIIFPTLLGEINIEYYFYYPSVGAIFSVIPILLFPDKNDRKILWSILIVCFVFTILSDNLLSYFSPNHLFPDLFANRYIFYKTSQVLLFIFTTSVVYSLRALNTRYSKSVEEKISLINKQSAQLMASNDELRAYSEKLNETYKELEHYKTNLEKLVSLRSAELKESEEKFRSYFMNSMDGIFITDDDGNYLEVNPAAELMTGYTNDELCSMNVYQLGLPSEAAEKVDRFKNVNSEGKNFEAPFRRKNGSVGYMIISAIQLSNNRRIGIAKEITDRKETEKELKKTKLLLEQTFNQCPIPMVLVSMPGAVIHMANPAALDLLGISDEPSYIGTNLFDFKATFQDFDNKGNINKFEDLPLIQNLQGKRTHDEEHRIVRKDGTERWELVSGVPIFNPEGELIAGYLVMNDITARKEAELALHESEEKFAKAFQNAPIMFSINDPSGKFIDCNEESLRIAGYTRKEVIGRTSVETGWLTPENRAKMRHELHSKGRISGLELEFKAKDGHKVVGLLNGEQIILSGKPCLLSVTLDITERKLAEEAIRQSESKYRRLHKSIIDGFASTDMQGKIIEFNEAFQNMLGYGQEELLNLTYEVFTPEKWHEFERNIIINEVIPNGFSKPYQKEYRKKDGTIFPVELRTYLLKNEAGENEGMWAIIRDITENKETERRILHAIVDAEEKERNYFAREIHDGLGPLLSTIRLYLQWIAKPSLKASKTDLLAKADVVIEDALTSAREISHKLSPQVLINFGLTPAIKSFIDRISGSTQTTINFVSNLEKRLNSDAEITIYRVINECINNSLKYASASNIDIILILEQAKIKMIYTDNGIGFDVSKKTVQSKGLGLYNMRNRVETLGGTITIESKKEEGARIELQIDIQNPITPK